MLHTFLVARRVQSEKRIAKSGHKYLRDFSYLNLISVLYTKNLVYLIKLSVLVFVSHLIRILIARPINWR